MAFNVALTYAQRDSLISLQHTDKLQQRTQRRLTSGREVNDVTDDVFRYFAAKSLADKSEELIEYNTNVNLTISALKANTDGIEKLVDLFKQVKGILIGSIGKSTKELQSLNSSLTSTIEAAAELWDDIGYQGVTLVKQDILSALNVRFSEKHTLKINSEDFFNPTFTAGSAGTAVRTGQGLRGTIYATGSRIFTYTPSTGSVTFNISSLLRAGTNTYASLEATAGTATTLNGIAENIQDIIKGLRTRSQEIAIYISILQVRFEYTTEHVGELNKGVDKYTLADINQEGAYLVSLQTRQQLGMNALAVSGRQQSSVLTLLQ